MKPDLQFRTWVFVLAGAIGSTACLKGAAPAEEGITRDYSLEAVLPRMLKLYDEAIAKRAGMPKVVKRPAAAKPKVGRSPFL